MKITPAKAHLSLMLHALQSVVAPEVTSAAGKTAVQMIAVTLADLLNRTGPSVKLLRQCVTDGTELEKELQGASQALLTNGTNRTAVPVPGEVVTTVVNGTVSSDMDFERLAEEHDRISENLYALCIKLSEAGSSKDLHIMSLLRRAAEWDMTYFSGLQNMKAQPQGESQSKESPLTKKLLEDFLNSRHGPLEVTAFSQLYGGFGKQTYLCTIHYAHGLSQDLVIRKADGAPLVEHSMFRLEQEFDLLRLLHQHTSYPSPVPLDLASSLPGVDGTFFTMERLPGKVPALLMEVKNKTFPEAMFLHLAELLAKLHRIPLETFAEYFDRYEEGSNAALKETNEERYRRSIRGWRDYWQSLPHAASSYNAWLFNWLEHNVPPDTRRPVLVHGDFNIHNMLVGEDAHVTGVLDWECADFGAPEQDLAYIKPHISKKFSWTRFLDHYLESGGQEISEDRMAFCAAFGVLRVTVGLSRGLSHVHRGTNRDIRLQVIELMGVMDTFMQIGLECTGQPIALGSKTLD